MWVLNVLFLDLVLCIALVSSEIEAYNLRSWLQEKDSPVTGKKNAYQEKHQAGIIETFTSKETGWTFWDELWIEA